MSRMRRSRLWLFVAFTAFGCSNNPLANTPLANTPLVPTTSDAGTTWKVHVPDPSVPNWRAVWAIRPDLAYAVGDDGAIVRFDGSRWTRVPSGTTEHLEDIWARAEDDLWAVGWNGTVLHSTGGDFAPVPSPTTRNLFGVYGTNDRLYIVGERGVILGQGDGGIREMYQETTLSEFDVCETRVDIYDTANNICPTNQIPVLLPDGTFDPNAPDYPVCNAGNCCGPTPLADDDPGACCYPFRCNEDGGVMRGRIGVDDDLKAVFARGDFAVACGAGGAIYEYGEQNGVGQWTKRQLADNVPFTRDNLAAAFGVGGSTWCAGQDGRRLSREGDTWRNRDIPTPVFVQGLWASGRRDQYAVGFSGVILRYNGYGADAGWFPEDIETAGHLRAVHGVLKDPDAGYNDDPDAGPPAARIFIVGSEGKILQKY